MEEKKFTLTARASGPFNAVCIRRTSGNCHRETTIVYVCGPIEIPACDSAVCRSVAMSTAHETAVIHAQETRESAAHITITFTGDDTST